MLEHDCGTLDGIEMTALIESGEIIEQLGDRVLGRVLLEDLMDPDDDNNVLVEAGEEITESVKEIIDNSRIEKIRIRSVFTCSTERGVCQLCYGRDLARGKLVSLGETVGVIAAQSIGEPGTQLTMRTFHIGGTASRLAEQNTWEAKFSGKLRFDDLKEVQDARGNWVVLGRRGEAIIVDDNGRDLERRPLPIGTAIRHASGAEVKQGELIAEWDPFSIPILTDVSGYVQYRDIFEGETFKEQVDDCLLYTSDAADE